MIQAQFAHVSSQMGSVGHYMQPGRGLDVGPDSTSFARSSPGRTRCVSRALDSSQSAPGTTNGDVLKSTSRKGRDSIRQSTEPETAWRRETFAHSSNNSSRQVSFDASLQRSVLI